MTEQPGGRDVLAELDSIEAYLQGLVGASPGPGLDVNMADISSRLVHLRPLVQGTIELAAEYASGITHEQRVAASTGSDGGAAAASARIAELERQLAEARGSNADG
jgi:hypothetical protein